MKKAFILLFILSINHYTFAQFHTLKTPQRSNYVKETQRLAVTDISITYSSPATRGRDVWASVIPQNGDPIPWRAGANLNTIVEFSTDVLIEGKALPAGKYGFHMIPKGENTELLFAHNYNQWGSYYLDLDKDITLRVEVQDTICPYSEKLDYEFLPKTENTMIIALEWAEKRIPFEVSVDLNKTVVASLRSELRGENTYRWEAWNDAAGWCLNHDTNLEEALEWTDRSIQGGYNGFAANKNLTNLTTKARLAKKLEKEQLYETTINEAFEVSFSALEANYFSIFLLRNNNYEKALQFTEKALDQYPKTWFLSLNNGISKYFAGKSEEAIQQLKEINSPDQFKDRILEIISEMETGEYQIPQ